MGNGEKETLECPIVKYPTVSSSKEADTDTGLVAEPGSFSKSANPDSILRTFEDIEKKRPIWEAMMGVKAASEKVMQTLMELFNPNRKKKGDK